MVDADKFIVPPPKTEVRLSEEKNRDILF